MEYKKSMIIIILAIFLLSIASVSASDANDTAIAGWDNGQIISSDESDDEVTLTDDSQIIEQGNDEKITADSSNSTFAALNELISGASNITLDRDYEYEGSGFDRGILIDHPITIDGQGHTIDAKHQTRIFLVFSSNVTLKNITFANAKAPNDYHGGGAVCWFSSPNGNISDCIFINNSADGDGFIGGALLWYASNEGIVSNCAFINNSCNSKDVAGGAVCWRYSYNGIVSNCHFENNSAKGLESDGGAIFWEDSNNGNVLDCYFVNNSAEGDGAAISWQSSLIKSDNGSVSGCVFVNNSAGNWGGAVHSYNSTGGQVSDCYFENNSACEGGAIYFNKDGEVTNCNFTDNKATGYGSCGGAVFFWNQGTVENCNFTGNTASGNGGAVYFFITGNVRNCNFTANQASRDGGAVFFNNYGNVRNCNFTNNTASGNGGAVYFSSTGTVTNCNFADNKATGDYSYGGAVRMYYGTVSNCNFTNNTASGTGGAFYFSSTGTVTNCNFTGNNATTGSAIYFYSTSPTKTVSNSRFLNNRANAEALEITKNDNNITITFTGQNNLLNAIYSRYNAEVAFTNVKYWGATGITTVSATLSGSNKAAGQNITVGVVVNDKIVLNEVMITDEEGMIVLNINAGDNYYITARHDTDSYYTEAERTISTMKFNVNVTSQTTTNRTVNITTKSNIYSEFMPGKLLFILPNGDEINATYAADGIWWAEHTFEDYGDYQVNASYIGLSNVTVNNATISITKANSSVDVSSVVMYYGETKNVTVKTEGAIAITAKINNADVSVVNNYTIPISGLDAGNYTLTVTTIPDEDHNPASKAVNITVNKAITEIILANETLYLKVGDAVDSGASIMPSGAGELDFTSSDVSVVTVDGIGTITAVGDGVANVTVRFTGNDNYAAAESKNITVTVSLNDASVSVNNSTLDLFVGDNFTIVAATSPAGLNVTFVPDNSGVYSVDGNGTVTALKEGTGNILVKVGGDGVYAENSTIIAVSVSKIPVEININTTLLDLFVGDETVIAANLTPAGAGNVTFTSSNDTVVTVDAEGNVIADGKGRAVITVSFAGDNKYASAQNKTVTVNVSLNDASVTVDNVTLDLNVGETCAINATKHPDTIMLDITYTSSNSSVASVDEKGVVTAVGEGSAVITVEVGDGEIYAINSTNVTVSVSKVPTEIDASPVTATYNVNKDMVITLKDAKGNPVSGENISVDLNGAKNYTTDENGSVKVSTEGLAPGVYAAEITFNGTNVYAKSAVEVNVTVKKATPKITAKAKTFKTTAKTKKYTITLKDNTGKPIKKATVYLKVGGKTYKATTNSKGKATFKITKLVKEGTYKATVTFKANKYYKKATKKVKITVKTAFKTVSRGSKDHEMVKKIQRVLKNNGYYLSAYGHYLKIDGIFHVHTENAVKQFQKDKGLKVTGKVDEKTAKKLKII